MPILEPNRPYTFRSYFELKIPTDEILAEFGYDLERGFFALPESSAALHRVAEVQQEIHDILPHVALDSEQAKREFLIAPVIKSLVYQVDIQVRVEYSIGVSPHLQGVLDYLIRYAHPPKQLIVVEAKRDNLESGFTQLAIEMIALDQWTRSPDVDDQPMILGAVTTGQIWQFGWLDRKQKRVMESLNLFRCPDELEQILRILVGALEG